MKRSSGSWFRIVVDLAVLLGLVFLVFELKQNTDMMRAQTRSDITQSILTLIEMERHPDLIAAHLQLARGEEVSEEQSYLLMNMANATLRVWENTYYQHLAGLFDDDEFEADLVVWGQEMTGPIFIEHWLGSRTTYSARFRNVIDGLIPD